MNLKAMILEHLSKATPEELNAGLTWYMRAHNEALLLSQVFELPLNKVIGVLAALSPNNKWQRNIQDTWKFLEKPHMNTKVCTFKTQRRKALNILKGSGLEEDILAELNGEKTKNFFTNIKYHDKFNRTTIDMWAYRSVNLEPKQKYYELVNEAYIEASKEAKMLPHQLQAVVWGIVRKSYV